MTDKELADYNYFVNQNAEQRLKIRSLEKAVDKLTKINQDLIKENTKLKQYGDRRNA